jgi:hypothetical protein
LERPAYFGFELLPLELLVSAPFELELLVDEVSPFFLDFDEVVEVLESVPMVPDVPEVPLALSVPVEPEDPEVPEEPDVPSEVSLPDELVPVEPEVDPELPVCVTPEPVTPLLFGDGVEVPPVWAITGHAARERADAPYSIALVNFLMFEILLEVAR